MNIFAINIFPDGGFKGLGDSDLANPGNYGINIFSNFLSSIIGLMTVIAIIWFIFLIFIGGFGIMTSGADKQAAESARKKITSGLIGLLVIISALFIVRFIGYILGIGEGDILDLPGLFNLIQL